MSHPIDSISSRSSTSEKQAMQPAFSAFDPELEVRLFLTNTKKKLLGTKNWRIPFYGYGSSCTFVQHGFA
jgi:hypothetical protein